MVAQQRLAWRCEAAHQEFDMHVVDDRLGCELARRHALHIDKLPQNVVFLTRLERDQVQLQGLHRKHKYMASSEISWQAQE